MIELTLLLVACILIFALVAVYFKNKSLKEHLQRLTAAQERAAAREQEREKEQALWTKNNKKSTAAGVKAPTAGGDRRRSAADRASKKPAPDKNKDQI